MTAELNRGPFPRAARFAVLIIVWALMGCREGTNTSTHHRLMVDDIGREVPVPLAPTRVISLAPSITEVVFAAGADGRLAAVTTADNYPPSVDEIRRITAFPLDHEGIVAVNPDLILATDQINAVRDLEALADLGIPSYFLQFNSANDVFAAIRTVGTLLNAEEHANRVADSLQAIWNTYLTRLDTTSYAPTVLLLAGYDVLYAFGRDSYTNEIIRAAGGRSLTEKLDGQAATLSDEFVLAERPDVIVGTFGDDFDVTRIVAAHPTWIDVPAVKNGSVHSINPDLISRPGPRIIDGARRLADWIRYAKSTDGRP